MSFLLLYNYQKKLKALKFKTPYDTMIQIYQDNPEYFKLNPEGKTLGLNKKLMLEHLDKKRAKYPAEHNVGHLYEAEDVLKNFYQEIDPTNTFNPGIGKMSKNKNYQ